MAEPRKKDATVKWVPLLLQCPGIQHATHIVTAVVEEGLIELLTDSSDSDWFTEGWYWHHLKDRIYDEHGRIKLAAYGDELWDFMKDPDAGIMKYEVQIDEIISNFYTLNETKITALSYAYDVKKVQVVKAFRDQWLVMVEGVPL